MLLAPGGARAQSGDASWLTNLEGLQTGIGRSWMAPLDFTAPDASATPVAGPAADNPQIQSLSALIFEFETPENAITGLEAFNATQEDQFASDPRAPVTSTFTPENMGDTAYGHEGLLDVANFDGSSSEWAVVYLLVQDGNLVYQVFGQFVPGNHIEIASNVVISMLEAETGASDPMYDMSGNSTGGLWEKLNSVQVEMPAESTVADLEIYPPADDAVMGDSVVVPQIDLANLVAVPGLTDSWHIAYGASGSATPVATPLAAPEGVFNIELWVMEFSDSTFATAAAFSLNTSINEPLGVVRGDGGGFGTGDSDRITMVSTGFVRDRSIPEGDAATVIVVEGNSLYAARVYANGPAPTPIATDLVNSLIDSEPGESTASVDGTVASGGTWERFPQSGDDLLHGLVPVVIEHVEPELNPVATPSS